MGRFFDGKHAAEIDRLAAYSPLAQRSMLSYLPEPKPVRGVKN